MNPACSGANAAKNRRAMANLDWMVNVNLFDNETGAFWRGPGMTPSRVKTEVFLLPAAVFAEKEGSITNSGRWMQWRYAGPKPLGASRPDGDIILALGRAIRRAYAHGGVFPEPILNLKWDYDTGGAYDPHKVARQINGFFLREVRIKGKTYPKGTLVPGFALLQDDGATSCGNWLYCGSYTGEGNMAARRGLKDAENGIGLYPEFAWCWPVNRRILYNRASVDPKGRPWDESRWVIRFAGEQRGGKWVTNRWEGDVPDGGWFPMTDPDGGMRSDSRYPFIMLRHGHGQIFGPALADGPFPEHYEPLESPLKINEMGGQRINPTAVIYRSDADGWASADSRFPYVATTHRVAEHWQSGLMSRVQPCLMELVPQMFVEMSPELAGLLGIRSGERVKVSSIRGTLTATAVVTARLRPLTIIGTRVHQVGLPWHFGWKWPTSGAEESANLLTPSAGDPNTRIPETKAFMVNVTKL
jgi:formate dehydrogenase major subunit